jgi:hypothetical protein
MFKNPKGSKPVATNTRAVEVASQTIDHLGATMQRTLANAITGDGRECLLYIPKDSEVITGGGGEVVEVGSKVLVQKEGTSEEKVYQIVGSEEADMVLGKISNKSPIGEAFYGKKKGDKVSFKTPGGIVNYKIINVY